MNTAIRLNDESARGFTQDEHGIWWHALPGGRRIRGRYIACKECGREFIVWRPAKYCSLDCERSRYNGWLDRKQVCAGCHQEFKARKKQRFCSHSCAATKMHATGERTTTKRDRAEYLIGADNPRYSQDDRGQWWYVAGSAARTRAQIARCEHCDKRFLTNMFHRKKQRFCTRVCGVKGAPRVGLKGKEATNWQGGRRLARGYVLTWAPDHPSRQGKARPYVFEHRLVMERVLGRLLRPEENVHHKNGHRDDNSESNLELWSTSQPCGQRVEDKMKWVWEMVELYEHLHPRPKPA